METKITTFTAENYESPRTDNLLRFLPIDLPQIHSKRGSYLFHIEGSIFELIRCAESFTQPSADGKGKSWIPASAWGMQYQGVYKYWRVLLVSGVDKYSITEVSGDTEKSYFIKRLNRRIQHHVYDMRREANIEGHESKSVSHWDIRRASDEAQAKAEAEGASQEDVRNYTQLLRNKIHFYQHVNAKGSDDEATAYGFGYLYCEGKYLPEDIVKPKRKIRIPSSQS